MQNTYLNTQTHTVYLYKHMRRLYAYVYIQYVSVYSSMYFYSEFGNLLLRISLSASYSLSVPSDCFLLCVSIVISYF